MDPPSRMLAWVSASANSQCSRERRRRSLSRTRLVASAWVLPKVASSRTRRRHALLDRPLGLDLERVYEGKGQSERLAGGLDGGLALRLRRIENDDSWLLSARSGCSRTRQARASPGCGTHSCRRGC
jgi:hypothetical protein